MDVAGGARPAGPVGGPAFSPGLLVQLRAVLGAHRSELSESLLAGALVAWTQSFGVISFELYGQLVGSVDPAGEFFGHATELMADLVGLPSSRPE